jgi:hypothetical protein
MGRRFFDDLYGDRLLFHHFNQPCIQGGEIVSLLPGGLSFFDLRPSIFE